MDRSSILRASTIRELVEHLSRVRLFVSAVQSRRIRAGAPFCRAPAFFVCGRGLRVHVPTCPHAHAPTCLCVRASSARTLKRSESGVANLWVRGTCATCQLVFTGRRAASCYNDAVKATACQPRDNEDERYGKMKKAKHGRHAARAEQERAKASAAARRNDAAGGRAEANGKTKPQGREQADTARGAGGPQGAAKAREAGGPQGAAPARLRPSPPCRERPSSCRSGAGRNPHPTPPRARSPQPLPASPPPPPRRREPFPRREPPCSPPIR